MGSDYYPAGVTYLPGEAPHEEAWTAFLEGIPHACAKCKQPTAGDGEHGFAPHVQIREDDHAPSATCAFQVGEDEDDVCEEDLATTNCGCRECDPPDHRGLD